MIKSSADVYQNLNKRLYSVNVTTPSMGDIIVAEKRRSKCCNQDSSGRLCLEMLIHGPEAVKGAKSSEV